MKQYLRLWAFYWLCGTLAASLLAGTTVIAQETPQSAPESDGSVSGDPSRPNFPVTSVRVPEVLSDSMGVDFAPYFQASILPPVRQNWRLAARQKGLTPSSGWKIVVEFTILKDGTLDGLKLAESSGAPEADQVALDAITRSAAFAALPAEFKGQSLRLRCRLDVFFPNSNGATMPQTIYQPDPEYSDQARRNKIEGVVVLSVVVNTDGRPTDIQVVRSLGSGLDEKAIEALTQWRFHPAVKDGSPVARKIAVEMSFHLYK